MMYKFSLKMSVTSMLSIPAIAFANGVLESPILNEIQSGVSIVSGWHCTGNNVEILIDGESIGSTGIGSVRNDTTSVCGHNRSGFGLLYNYNILEDGNHLIQAYVDGVLLDQREFTTIRSGGVPFLQGKSSTTTVNDFPSSGNVTTLSWSQAKQSFVVTKISRGDTSGSGDESQLNQRIGMDKLIGSISLTYRFNSGASIYRDDFSFNRNNISDDGKTVISVISSTKIVGCAVIEGLTRGGFSCFIQNNVTRTVDSFIFNIDSSGSISGVYRYCLNNDLVDCGVKTELAPSGTVTGRVTYSQTRSAMAMEKPSTNYSSSYNSEHYKKLIDNDETSRIEIERDEKLIEQFQFIQNEIRHID